MKQFKVVALILGLASITVAGFVLRVATLELPQFDRVVPPLKVEVSPERVARGKKWVTLVCAECHENRTTGRLSGRNMNLDDSFGVVHSFNITQHPTKGLGAWADADIAYLLRTGVARDGRYTPPWMPKFPNMADEDVAAVIAFLRSDDPMVAPSEVDSIPSQPKFFTRFLLAIKAFSPLPYPQEPVVAPSTTDSVASGRYLVWNLGCWTCHSRDLAKLDFRNPERTPGYLGGGHDGASNITPDVETGLGRWNEEKFVKSLREGVRAKCQRVPIRPGPRLSVDEAKAIFTYLKTVPPLKMP